MHVVLTGLYPDLMPDALALYLAAETELTEEEAFKAVADFVEIGPPDPDKPLVLHPRDPMAFLPHVVELGATGYVVDDEGRSLMVTPPSKPAEPPPPWIPQEEINAEAAQIIERLRENPRLWWAVLDAFPRIVGPWHEAQHVAGNWHAAWYRRVHGGGEHAKVIAQVVLYKDTPSRPGRIEMMLRSEECSEWGMVDCRRELPSFAVGMLFADAELRKRGWLLVPNDPGTL